MYINGHTPAFSIKRLACFFARYCTSHEKNCCIIFFVRNFHLTGHFSIQDILPCFTPPPQTIYVSVCLVICFIIHTFSFKRCDIKSNTNTHVMFNMHGMMLIRYDISKNLLYAISQSAAE